VLAKIPVAPEAGEAKASPNGRRPVPARTAAPSAPPLHLR
jgi:hypothetical protein